MVPFTLSDDGTKEMSLLFPKKEKQDKTKENKERQKEKALVCVIERHDDSIRKIL
jgi:hypothetical protein